METILLVPEYSHEIRGSILQVTQRLLRYAATRDDLKLVVPYPKEGSRWKNWTPEKWEVHADNIEFVPVLMDKYSECALGRVSSDWANSRFGGRKDYSVVATMRSTSAFGIKRLFSKPMVGFTPDVVNLYLIGGIDYFKTLAKDLPQEMLCHFLAGWNILYGTEGFANLIHKRLGELFAPAVLREVRNRTISLSLGIPLETLRKIRPMAKEAGKIRMVYGGRLAAEKGISSYMEIADDLFSAGYDMEFGLFLVFDRWGENESKLQPLKRPYTKIFVNAVPVEDNYFAYAASADFFLCASKYEAAALSFHELLYLGVPGLFLDAPWLKGFVPDDYPFIYSSRQELNLAARAFCTRVQNGDSLPYDMDRVKRYIEENHSRNKCEKTTLDLLVALSRARNEKIKINSWWDICA